MAPLSFALELPSAFKTLSLETAGFEATRPPRFFSPPSVPCRSTAHKVPIDSRHPRMSLLHVLADAQALCTTLLPQPLIPYLHPVFYSLYNMPTECGTISEQGVVLPHPLPLTSERLERHGLFLMEDGQNIFLWVG
ncbi:hypothetical protein JCM10207_009309, partial [Rhodosporidiobolus poonsookiae]